MFVPDFMFVGLHVVICVFFLVVLLEAVLLTKLRWARFRRSLPVSFFADSATTAIGFVFRRPPWITSLAPLGRVPTIALLKPRAYSGPMPLTLTLLILWGLSGLIEGGVLWLMSRPQRARRILWASLVSNLASYALLWLLWPK
jgi:hypothetical protein